MTKSDFSGFWVEEERKGDAIVNIGNVWRKGLLLGILLLLVLIGSAQAENFTVRVDGRLKSYFSYGAFERDADIGRGVHGPDGLRFHARHHEAARTLGCGGHLGKGAVIVGGRLLHKGRKGCAGLGRRGVVVRYGIE